eukprot:1136153-Pelagomonas_calceolata.AAC.1
MLNAASSGCPPSGPAHSVLRMNRRDTVRSRLGITGGYEGTKGSEHRNKRECAPFDPMAFSTNGGKSLLSYPPLGD